MATSFDEIYDVFLSNLSDEVFMENDLDDSLKLRYLKNAITKFRKCKKNLSDRTDAQFNEDLSEDDIQILGLLMVPEYLNPQIVSLNNIKQSMGTKDFTITSQASFLESLMFLRKERMREVNKMILDYTYNNGKLGNLR